MVKSLYTLTQQFLRRGQTQATYRNHVANNMLHAFGLPVVTLLQDVGR